MTQSFPDRDLRQRGLIPVERLARVHATVIGVGAIGRQVALQLASAGVRTMTLYDHDHVAVENLAVQGYWPLDLGQPKVQATAKLCQQILPDLEVTVVTERYRRHTSRPADSNKVDVAFVCVDSITTRKMLWQELRGQMSLYLDGRMHAEVLRVLASDERTDPVHYTATLFSEQEAYSGACTSRSTIYSASIAAGLMVAQLARWLRGVAVVPDQTLNLLSSELIVSGDDIRND